MTEQNVEEAVPFFEVRSMSESLRFPFVGNAMWVTSFRDRDGYCIDFESSTDVTEGTRLGEYRG